MERQTLEHLRTSIEEMRARGLISVGAAAGLHQVLTLVTLYRTEVTELEARATERDRQIAAVKADQARLDAALAEGDDLDLFQAGYEKGYRLGWEHALQAAKAAGPRDFLTGQP